MSWAPPAPPQATRRRAALDLPRIQVTVAPLDTRRIRQDPPSSFANAKETVEHSTSPTSDAEPLAPAQRPLDPAAGEVPRAELPQVTPRHVASQAANSQMPSAELPGTPAEYLHNPPPAYPSISRNRGEQGRVLVSVLVTVEGLVKHAAVEVSSGFPWLDESAIAAVRTCRFVPAKLRGVAVEMTYQIPIRFELDLSAGN